MPLFRRRKQLDNAAIIAPPPPISRDTTVNNYYSSSRMGTIFSLFVVAVVAVILTWHGLVFLAGQVGFVRPNQAAAYCLLTTGITFALMSGFGALAKFFLKDYFDHRERMAQKLVELEQAHYRTVQLIPPTTQARMTREEARKYQAVKLVMDRAYQVIDENGKLSGKTEPWSRREVGRLQLINERSSINENSKLASWVKSYLLNRGILLDDRQVNIADFPNLASVEAQLVKDFGPPIVYRAGDDGGMSTHYLDKGTGSGSWG